MWESICFAKCWAKLGWKIYRFVPAQKKETQGACIFKSVQTVSSEKVRPNGVPGDAAVGNLSSVNIALGWCFYLLKSIQTILVPTNTGNPWVTSPKKKLFFRLRHHWRFLPPTISYEYICTYTLYTRNPVQPQCTQILQYMLCGSFWIFLALSGSVGPFWLSYWIWCLRAEKTHRPPDRWSRDLIKVSTSSKKPCGLVKPQPLLGTRWHRHTVGTNSLMLCVLRLRNTAGTGTTPATTQIASFLDLWFANYIGYSRKVLIASFTLPGCFAAHPEISDFLHVHATLDCNVAGAHTPCGVLFSVVSFRCRQPAVWNSKTRRCFTTTLMLGQTQTFLEHSRHHRLHHSQNHKRQRSAQLPSHGHISIYCLVAQKVALQRHQ